MNTTETNIFPIQNLLELRARFHVYRVVGLRPDQTEFHRNRMELRNVVARECAGRPVELISRSEGVFLAIAEEAPEPPASVMLIRGQAALEKTTEAIEVDFSRLTPETESLAQRLLQSCVQDRLRSDRRIWQPKGGGLFFEKHAARSAREVGLHRGFQVRVVPTPGGGFGLCVDVRCRFIATNPLSPTLRRAQFGRFKMSTVVYKYGHTWYEVRLADISEFNVQKYLCGESGATKPLLDWIHEHCPRPLPKEITSLDKEGAVVEYETADGERRGAPAQLCYEVYDTQAPAVQREHGRTILEPYGRKYEIGDVVKTYFRGLQLGRTPVKVANTALVSSLPRFAIPDYRFGNNRILSVRRTPGAELVSIGELGKARLRLLEDRNAGFFVHDPLYRQHFFMPASVRNSWGPVFLSALTQMLDRLYPQAQSYAPKLVIYDDRHATNYVQHGQAIVAAAKADKVTGGFAVVMLADRQGGASAEDALSGYVMRELAKPEHDLVVATIHASSGEEFYELNRHANRYETRRDQGGRFRGYLRNVALNKVLLTSSKWPFVLATPLHADVVVGIDVKGNTAGFSVISRQGDHVFTRTRVSRQKEKLLTDQCRQYLVAGIKEVAQHSGVIPRRIIVHRDGRLFDTELSGIRQAVDDLIKQGIVAADAELTCIEIPKKSFISVRLFDQVPSNNGTTEQNPEVGTHLMLGPDDGYLCTTGRSFLRRGSVQPLHLRRVHGPMPLADCMEDVFSLASLTWTQPEGCARHPISIKLNDRQLFEAATDFDRDAFDFAPTAAGEEGT